MSPSDEKQSISLKTGKQGSVFSMNADCLSNQFKAWGSVAIIPATDQGSVSLCNLDKKRLQIYAWCLLYSISKHWQIGQPTQQHIAAVLIVDLETQVSATCRMKLHLNLQITDKESCFQQIGSSQVMLDCANLIAIWKKLQSLFEFESNGKSKLRTDLTDSNNANGLWASYSQSRYSKIIKIIALKLCIADILPSWLCKVWEAIVLQNFCKWQTHLKTCMATSI